MKDKKAASIFTRISFFLCAVVAGLSLPREGTSVSAPSRRSMENRGHRRRS